MKKIIIIILIIINILFIIPTKSLEKSMGLNNKTIIIDPGHGGIDVGTNYKELYEKDLNLTISLYLKKELEKIGANVVLTREDDYDLSSPNTSHRKKSDFDNRIKLINETNSILVLSIHQNYFNDSNYSGTQIFYKDNYDLGDLLQKKLNPERKVKKIDSKLYMYNKTNKECLLIECGFLSNESDRKNLTNSDFIENYVKKIALTIKEYYQ